MSDTPKKPGRPPGSRASTKFPVTLQPEQLRQLDQLKTRIFGGNSVVVATAIDRLHTQYKKEWPDEFN